MKRKTGVRRGAFMLAVMMLLSLCGMLPTAALAEGAPDPAVSPQEAAPLQDHLVSTKHTAVINGTELAYTAEAGTMVLTTGAKPVRFFIPPIHWMVWRTERTGPSRLPSTAVPASAACISM